MHVVNCPNYDIRIIKFQIMIQLHTACKHCIVHAMCQANSLRVRIRATVSLNLYRAHRDPLGDVLLQKGLASLRDLSHVNVNLSGVVCVRLPSFPYTSVLIK